MPQQYTVGIDLGTTHTVVAYARLGVMPPVITLFDIEQLVSSGEVAARPLLPSVRYHAAVGEIAPGDVELPWPPTETPGPAPVVFGQWARQLGSQVPGRLVASAKSWLSHPDVDRLAPILPWGAGVEVPKISPVDASASYLRYVRAAWNARFPDSLLEQQGLVLTVPASFDEAARALTLRAAAQAGLPTLRLLEEPQAVFYDWLFRHRDHLHEELAQTRRVLVCDVGGGTTDLSLIEVALVDGEPQLTRSGVGNHLMLGGDNMDLALAHRVETRLTGSAKGSNPTGSATATPLSASQLAQLMERCRSAKELLLARGAPEQVQVTLLGDGSRLIGGSRSASLQREDISQLIMDGFFPQVTADAQAQSGRRGLVAFGLPYARDPAITRHIADFLRQHAPAMPDTLLLNGGVFRADALVARLTQTLATWRGAPLRLLHNDNPDVAVARGAVAYALSQQGLAPKIGGGAARSYYLLLDDASSARTPQGLCLLPRGTEPGQEVLLAERTFALRLGQPVRFLLATSMVEAAGQAPHALGQPVAINAQDFARLPPITLVLPASRRQDVTVQLVSTLTEVGTLEVYCVSLADRHQRWRLEFDLRHTPITDPADEDSAAERLAHTHMVEATDKINRVFGTNSQQVSLKDVKQLRSQLEQILGERARWTTPVLRQLFDALWARARGRRRSVEHERGWLNLIGFCLRPGFGDALDSWRITQLWPIFVSGVQFAQDKQVGAEWWTLWRRVAGGLDTAAQQRLLQDFAYNLQRNEAGNDDPANPAVKGSDEDMLRLGAALERIPVAHKIEIGSWLLARLQKPLATDNLTLWALGRLGARQLFYGHSHDVVPAETAIDWLDALLALDWKRLDSAAFAAVQLARVTDDRVRDLPLVLREKITARLAVLALPQNWTELVRHKVALDEATERRALGESLPPGLKLLV
jgi:molecular chaperone DnaK (HSP70)